MTIEVDAIVLGEGTEPGTYEVLPGGSVSSVAYDAPVQAMSILKEELTANEKVTIVQNGSGFGVVRKVEGIRGCLSIPESIKMGAMMDSPAMAACSYIGQRAGLTINPYRVGIVTAIIENRLTVEYALGSFYSGKTENLLVAPIAGITTADFAVDDNVLVNAFEYNQPMVVGWWSAVDGSKIEMLWGANGWDIASCPITPPPTIRSEILDFKYFSGEEYGFTGYSYAVFTDGEWRPAFWNAASFDNNLRAGFYSFALPKNNPIPNTTLNYRIMADNQPVGSPPPLDPFYDTGWNVWSSPESFAVSQCITTPAPQTIRFIFFARYLKNE